jgi:ubiquinol-cytochrome c reductase cytochrome b subunit
MSKPKFKNPVVKWIDYRLPIFTFMDHELNHYPTPKNLNYFWNFGSLAGIALITMIVTGIVLSMNYTAHVDHAFDSVERIMRDVNHFMDIRCFDTSFNDGYSFYGICIALGADELLGSDGYY